MVNNAVNVINGGVSGKVKRIRNGGPRSKRGCVTCRLRRVKCDETRPSCTRCTKSKRKCEGFPSLFAPTKPWEFVEDPSFGSMIRPTTNPRVASNEHAMHSFRFFERETVPVLAEVFGKDLWTVTLPRAAMHDPVIWYAAVALGSAHETHFLMARGPDITKPQMDWAFEQYNRAIRSFTAGDGQGNRTDPEVAIAASIIFMVFEVSRHELKKALSHAKSGINMHREHRRSSNGRLVVNSSSGLIPSSQLERGLRQMELQLCEVTLDDEASIYLTLLSMFVRNDVPHRMTWGSTPAVSILFDDLRLEIQLIWHSLMDKLYFIFDASDDSSIVHENAVSDDYASFRDNIDNWRSRAFDVKQEIWPMLDDGQKAHFQTLTSYTDLVSMFVDVFGLRSDAWDHYSDHFERVLDMCGSLIALYGQLLARDEKSLEVNCAFNGNNGFIVLLFHVFWRCKSARIRERAREMIKQYPRRKFSWDSPMVLDICGHIEEIERGPGKLSAAAAWDYAPEEIAQWRRIRTIGIRFNYDDQSSELTYVTSRSANDDTEVATKRSLPWGEKGVFG